MSREAFVGQWVVTDVTGKTPEKLGNKIATSPEGKEQIRIESRGRNYSFCEIACWEPVTGTPGKLVFTRTVDGTVYHSTVVLHDSPGGRALYCVEKVDPPPGTDTGSWTADDSSGPWEEG